MNILDTIARCIQRDPAAERELYYAYAKRIYGLCRRYVRDDHQAKDYMQESFQKIFLNIAYFPSLGFYYFCKNNISGTETQHETYSLTTFYFLH